MNIYKEYFDNLNHLMQELHKRPNNLVFQNKNQSFSGKPEFTGTQDWDEAVSLLKYGYTDILPQIKEGIKRNATIYKEHYYVHKDIPSSSLVGYIPHVPNAIAHLPNSMITIERALRKQKVISIFYNMSVSCYKK